MVKLGNCPERVHLCMSQGLPVLRPHLPCTHCVQIDKPNDANSAFQLMQKHVVFKLLSAFTSCFSIEAPFFKSRVLLKLTINS